MKQFLFLVMLLSIGVSGSILVTPAAGVAVYYLFSMLRPQYLWQFQLTGYPAITWSFFLAAASIGSYLLWSVGLLSYGKAERSVMRYSPAFTFANKMMMFFAFWITLSFIFSNNRDVSEEWYGEYVKIFVMYFVAARVIRTPNQIWLLYMIFTICIAYIAFDENSVYVQNGGVVRFYKRGFARLDNNGVGLMMALAMPMCYFAWEMTRRWYRWIFLFALVSIVHAVMITYSRGAMLSMFPAAIMIMLYTKKRLFYCLVLLVMTGLISVMAGKEIVARFSSINTRENDLSWKSRETSWGIAKEIANDYPLVGAGIRCSGAEMLQRGADMEGRTIHSQYLQLAADSGWIAMLIYIGTAGSAFLAMWTARRRLWKRTDPDSVRAVCILGGIECGLISFLVGGAALSLEVFEPPYLLMLMGAQVLALLKSSDTAVPEIQNYRQTKLPMPVPRPVGPPVQRYERPTPAGPASSKSVLAPPSSPRMPFNPWLKPKPPRRGTPGGGRS
ncbi:hypothetical protein BH11PLA2_BH11PLA2_20610 [soil metagenome]